MKNIDLIDQIAATVTDIDSELIYSKKRTQRVTFAKFIAINLRHLSGWDIIDIAKVYGIGKEPVRYAIRKAVGLERFDADFRKRYAQAKKMYKSGCVPYCQHLIACGVGVRTRIDSSGVSMRGIVTSVEEYMFTVELFDDITYKTVNYLATGRLYQDYECARDVVAIEV